MSDHKWECVDPILCSFVHDSGRSAQRRYDDNVSLWHAGERNAVYHSVASSVGRWAR